MWLLFRKEKRYNIDYSSSFTSTLSPSFRIILGWLSHENLKIITSSPEYWGHLLKASSWVEYSKRQWAFRHLNCKEPETNMPQNVGYIEDLIRKNIHWVDPLVPLNSAKLIVHFCHFHCYQLSIITVINYWPWTARKEESLRFYFENYPAVIWNKCIGNNQDRIILSCNNPEGSAAHEVLTFLAGKIGASIQGGIFSREKAYFNKYFWAK